MAAPRSQPELRAATSGDIPELIDVAGRSFYDAYIPYDDPDEIRDYVREHFTPEYFRGLIDAPNRWVDVLTVEGDVSGYLVMQQSDAPDIVDADNPLELARLYLRSEDVGRGYGRTLMARAFEIARAGGFSALWLLVYRQNTAAQAFYTRYGFEEVGVVDFWFGGRVYKDPIMVAPVLPAR